MVDLDKPYKACKVKMHSKLLYLQPQFWEQHYFSQLEGLDLLNCLITPLFFASTLARWPRSFLSSVYCMVLAIKGYQMALLLLPAARRYKAHAKARYWIILAERILRQFVATPALGRGERFVQWMRDMTAADPGPVTAVKLAMLVSGTTHTFWNAFCLPLDIVSQVVLNVIFFLLHCAPVLCQVAYPVGMLVAHKQRLVWLQWALERAASGVAWPLKQLVAAAASRGVRDDMDTVALQQRCQDAFALVAQPPGRAPDLETPAGRLVLAASMALMLLVVLYLPLVFAWRLERHLKARFMLTVMQKAGGSSSSESTSASTSTSSSPCESPSAKAGAGSSKAALFAPAGHAAAGSSSSSSWEGLLAQGNSTGAKGKDGAAFISPPESFPLFPTVKGALLRHLGVAGAVCFVAGEVFVWVCTVSPLVASVLWQQIPGSPSPTRLDGP